MSFIRYQLDLVRSPNEAFARMNREADSALIGFKNILEATQPPRLITCPAAARTL